MADTLIRWRRAAVATVCLAFLPSCGDTFDSTAGLAPEDSIVGVWAWQADEHCTEVYSFFDDQTSAAISGRRVTLGLYAISDEVNDAGRYEMSHTILVNLRGRSCSGELNNVINETAIVFVEFDRYGNTLTLWEDPVDERGIGPFSRISH